MHRGCRSRTVLAAAFLALAAPAAWAVDRTWTGATSANWGTASNWTGNAVPGAADRAIIPPVARLPVITNNPAGIQQLVVQAGATLTINQNRVLRISGNVSPTIDGGGVVVTNQGSRIEVNDALNNGVLINGPITLGNFILDAPAGEDYRIAAGLTVTVNGYFRTQQGEVQLGAAAGAAVTLDVNGALRIDNNGELEVVSPASVIRVSGNWIQDGVWNSGTDSTVIFDGTAAQTIDIDRTVVGQFDFENLRISNTAAPVTYTNNNPTGFPNGFNVLDNLTLDPGARLTVQDFAVVGNSAGDLLSIGSGAQLTFTQQFDPDCTITFAPDAGAQNGVLTLQGTLLPPNDSSDFGFALVPGRGTVRLMTTANDTFFLADGGPFTFFNLEIDTNGGNGLVATDVITVASGFTVLGDLVLTEGQLQVPAVTVTVAGSVVSTAATVSMFDFSAAGTLRVAGNVDLDNFSQATGGAFGLLHLNGTAPQTLQIRAATASSYHDFDHVQVSNPAGATVLDNPNADFRVNGFLALDAGARLTVRDSTDPEGAVTLAAGATVLRLEGAIVDDASEMGSSFSAGIGSTVVYAGQGVSQTVFTRINAAVPIGYHHLTIDNTGAAVATQEAGGLLDVNGSFTVLQADAQFAANGGAMDVALDFVDHGTFSAVAHATTLSASGVLAGTGPVCTFNQLFVNAAVADVRTVSRGFTTTGTFTVVQGRMTTAGLAAPITISALLGHSVGNNAGGAGVLELEGPVTFAVGAGQSFLVRNADGSFIARRTASGTPTLTRSGGAGSFDTLLDGSVDIFGMNFSFGNAAGLEISELAAIVRLRAVSFTGIDAAAGARFLTLRSPGLDLDIVGCFFGPLAAGQFNVQLTDTAPGGAPVRVRLEDRGPAPPGGGGGGPGAGEAFDQDADTNDNGVIDGGESAGGAIAQWVYAANIDMTGAVQGFPMPAFDWNTGIYYSTYVLMRNSSGATDTIYVLNADGDPKGYSFSLPATDIVGPLFWDGEAGVRVVYFGTSTGQIYRLVDTGAGFVVSAGWPFTDPSLVEVTSAIMSDQVNLYFGGRGPAAHGIYKVAIAGPSMPAPAISTSSVRVSTAPSWWDGLTGRNLFVASSADGALSPPGSRIYRVVTGSWTVDAFFTSASLNPPADDCTADIVAITNVVGTQFDPSLYLYVGETNGWMHALTALGTPAQFLVPQPGFPFRDATDAIRGGAITDYFSNRLFFGNDAGDVYTMELDLYAGAWTLGTNYFRLATGSPVRTMPLYLGGILYAANAAGQLWAVDASAQSLVRRFTFFGGAALGDVSRDFNTGRVYVATAGGRLYSIPDVPDPTPAP